MLTTDSSNSIDACIADITSIKLPWITKLNLSQLVSRRGFSQRQVDSAISRMNDRGLLKVGFRNVRNAPSVPRELPIKALTEEFIRSVFDRSSDGSMEAQPTQVIAATQKLAGLMGRVATGDLEPELLECYLRVGHAFTVMTQDEVPGVETLEALWPRRNTNSRVAYARFKTVSAQVVCLAAAQPKNYKEAKHWLESLKRSGRRYVIC
jgi:hypothetical protein